MSVASYRTRRARAPIAELNNRQEKVRGFSLERCQEGRCVVIGGGGIGSNVALGMVRKGFGAPDICDDDTVENSNLSRQLFDASDVGKNKAQRLIRHLRRHAMFPIELRGFPYRFQEMQELYPDVLRAAHFFICGVDNNPTRIAVTRHALLHGIPVIHAAVARDGGQLTCFVQEPGAACFGCAFPNAINDDSYPCDLPGIIDVLQAVAGIVVYAVDTLLCGRHREWNLRSIVLDGSVPDTCTTVPRKPDCALCAPTGSEASDAQTAAAN